MEPGLAGEIEGRWHGVRHLRLAALQDPRDPHHPPMVPVSNATCRGCHATLQDELIGDAWQPLVRPTAGLAPLGLRPNHSGHLGAAAESCARCHGPSHRTLSADPLACGACHPTVGHTRERTARARSPGAFQAIAPPEPPPPPPLPPPPPPEEGEAPEDTGPPLRCSAVGIARCGACHNGTSHGNGTKPPGLPDITAGGDTFTCRRCHPTGRW